MRCQGLKSLRLASVIFHVRRSRSDKMSTDERANQVVRKCHVTYALIQKVPIRRGVLHLESAGEGDLHLLDVFTPQSRGSPLLCCTPVRKEQAAS